MVLTTTSCCDLQLACRFGSPIKTMHRPMCFLAAAASGATIGENK